LTFKPVVSIAALLLFATPSGVDAAVTIYPRANTDLLDPPALVFEASAQQAAEPPSPKVYWGAWMDGHVYDRQGEPPWGDAPWDGNTWDEFERNVGKSASIVHFGQPAPWNQVFDATPLTLSRERGAIPLMDMASNGASLQGIAAGTKDTYLIDWARAVADYGKPFFFRWDWEMNGSWFHWGQEAAENPALFVEAWRHFHDIAEAQGALNITWVWCPNTTFASSTPLESLYPGDSYVDWTCVDGYNHGLNEISPNGWTDFHSLFSQTYNELLSLAPTKPVMIAETGSTEVGGGASKAEWITGALGPQLAIDFPQVKAVVWFNWNIPTEDGEAWDWPIESSPNAEAAFASAISSPYYAGDEFGDLPALTRIQPLP